MFDSYIEEYLPFKSDPKLLDEYIFSDGKIRTGKLLEGNIYIYFKKNAQSIMRNDSQTLYFLTRFGCACWCDRL